ncbi:SRPBCC family protein [Candidatus Haliotispira prima]|uniref:SRPBCC family protein n=1 Tax=Candidatus Haliotispira prima TaxID=3034016 RepID=A0ABY8MJJ5_9SPIO|nr:SRPBCC family protein [Candidatus Haliotispira prima]
MIIVISLIALVLIIGLIYLARLDGHYEVIRDIEIGASKETIFPYIAVFQNWASWSPWLVLEPEAKQEYFGENGTVGSGYSWQGELVGAGKLTHEQVRENESVYCKLEFLKPFKNLCYTGLTLEEQGDKTKVSWTMNGKMSFFFRPMIKWMEPMIGMDYERGLKMLAQIVTDGKIIGNLKAKGVTQKDSFSFVGIRTEASFSQLSETMPRDFQKLIEFAQKSGIKYADSDFFSKYEKMDMLKGQFTYVAGMQVTEVPEVPGTDEGDEDIITGSTEPSKAYLVDYKGSYENIGNAWSLANYKSRKDGYKIARNKPSYEWYIKGPNSVNENGEDEAPENWHTEVLLAVK